MARSRKTPKPKLPTHERIDRKADHRGVYTVLDNLVKAHRPDLADAKIAVAWRYGWKRNKDGQIVLGKCKKASDLDKQFHDMDFVIILNFEAWTEKLTPDQRTALMHHELEHAAISEDQNGNPKKDARGRQMYRVRKHDLEEFRSIVKEYGCYKSDIEDFVRTAMTGKKPPQPTLPLFDVAAAAPKIEERLRDMGHDVTVTNGTPSGAKPADSSTAAPTWRAMPIREALDENFEVSPKTITTLVNLGINTAGELADRLLANQTFGLRLVEVQPLCEVIEQISSDDENPVKFSEVTEEPEGESPVPAPSTNGYHHANGKPSTNGNGKPHAAHTNGKPHNRLVGKGGKSKLKPKAKQKSAAK